MNIKPLILLSLLILCACNTLSSRNTANRLDSTINAYESALRWGRAGYAASLHMNREGVQAPVDLDHIERFRIIKVATVEKSVDVEAGTAITRILIAYHSEDSSTIREIKPTLIWWLNEDNKSWFIESPFPEIR